MEMLSFVDVDLFPGGEAIWKVPAGDGEADTLKDRDTGILRAPESGWKRIWGAKWRRGGGHSRWGKDRLSDDGGRGKILSRGKRRAGGRVVQVERFNWGEGVGLWMRRSSLGLLMTNALRATL